MKTYAICFTLCLMSVLLFFIPIEKVQIVQHITHDLVELKSDDNNQSDVP
jgi:hypothetical protein